MVDGKRREYNQQYYLDNREVMLERARKRYQEKRDLILAQASERYYGDEYFPGVMLERARRRAKQQGATFSITVSDVVIPERCPVFGMKLERSRGGHAAPNSPSLDRIDPSKGYVPGNVQVMSMKANQAKSNLSADELAQFAKWIFFNVQGAEYVLGRLAGEW